MEAAIVHRFVQFIMLIALLPFSACTGQPEPRTYTVGVINMVPEFDPIFVTAQAELARRGYVTGDNLTFLYAGHQTSPEEVQAATEAYLAQDADAIISIGTPATLIVKQLTAESQTPVIFGATDPVSSGLVESLAAPGANLTGATTGLAEDRRLDLLLRIVPDARRIYIPYNPADPSPTAALTIVRQAAEALGVELVTVEAESEEAVLAAIAAIPDDVDAVFLLPDSLLTAYRTDWSTATLARNLPISTPPPITEHVIMTYGFELEPGGRQIGRIVADVLDGANPGTLPIEPIDLVLTVDLRTAAALGIEIPYSVLEEADRIIR
jgi:putative ABC transport system substrate-binding protein